MNDQSPNPACAFADPLAGPRRTLRGWALSGCLCVPLAVWACWSAAPTRRDASPPRAEGRTTSGSPARQPLRPEIELAAFDAPIWTLDPPPTVAAAPPPLRLQLVGLVREGDGSVLKAVLYNQETDELLIVAVGDRVGAGGRSVAKVEASGVTLSDGRRLLMEGGSP